MRGKKRIRIRKRDLSQMAWRSFVFIYCENQQQQWIWGPCGFLCKIWLLYNLSVIISVQDVRLRPQRNVTEIGVLFNEKHPGVYWKEIFINLCWASFTFYWSTLTFTFSHESHSSIKSEAIKGHKQGNFDMINLKDIL